MTPSPRRTTCAAKNAARRRNADRPSRHPKVRAVRTITAGRSARRSLASSRRIDEGLIRPRLISSRRAASAARSRRRSIARASTRIRASAPMWLSGAMASDPSTASASVTARATNRRSASRSIHVRSGRSCSGRVSVPSTTARPAAISPWAAPARLACASQTCPTAAATMAAAAARSASSIPLRRASASRSSRAARESGVETVTVMDGGRTPDPSRGSGSSFDGLLDQGTDQRERKRRFVERRQPVLDARQPALCLRAAAR